MSVPPVQTEPSSVIHVLSSKPVTDVQFILFQMEVAG